MKTTYTSGPWTASDEDVVSSSGELLASAYSFRVNGKLRNTPETFANARLIAAAPDLAETLAVMLDVADFAATGQEAELHRRAENALKKAGL
jgi:hypothetical protein